MPRSTRAVDDNAEQVVVTGAAGQLGRALTRECRGRWSTVALDRSGLDLARPTAFLPALRALRATVVINCAALTDTARCEREPALAEALNAEAPALLAQACRATGAYFIQISTNEVFDGRSHQPYGEDAATGPLNAYARSKRRAEELVLEAAPDALVLRTAWLYGEGSQNFVQRVLGWAARQTEIAVVEDEVGTPTACATVAVATQVLLSVRPSGILHLTDAGSASRFEWAREILRLAGDDPLRVRPARLADFPDAVRKPRYSVLSTARAEQIGVQIRPWRAAFAEFMAAYGGDAVRGGVPGGTGDGARR